MKFELFKKVSKTGRRRFKLVIHEIYNDTTQTNLNGINWLEEYTLKNINSIVGMSLRCEFLDDERREICGHGFTEVVENVPLFPDATVVGHFDKAYIGEVDDGNGGKIKACIGEGEIDGQAYPAFCEKLDEDLANGIFPAASVEIMHSPNNEEIVYLNGYDPNNRTPVDYIYSGMALLAVPPADPQSRLLELNNKKEKTMNEKEIKALISQTVTEMSSHESEINECKKNCEKQIAEANAARDAAIAEKNELEANAATIQAALDAVKAEMAERDKKWEELWAEKKVLEKELAEVKAKERINEMQSAIAGFSEDEKKYAEAEINAFTENPTACEINTIVCKIYEGIGKSAKVNEKAVAAQNSANANTEDVADIFGEILETNAATEDINIF